MEDNRPVTETISSFLKLMNDIEKQFNAAASEVQKYDLLEQDLLHKLELQQLNAVQLMQLIKNLKQCRTERRHYKDRIETLAPIREFAMNPLNKKTIHNMQEMLGSVRAKERTLTNRRYIPRVLSKESYEE